MESKNWEVEKMGWSSGNSSTGTNSTITGLYYLSMWWSTFFWHVAVFVSSWCDSTVGQHSSPAAFDLLICTKCTSFTTYTKTSNARVVHLNVLHGWRVCVSHIYEQMDAAALWTLHCSFSCIGNDFSCDLVGTYVNVKLFLSNERSEVVGAEQLFHLFRFLRFCSIICIERLLQV